MVFENFDYSAIDNVSDDRSVNKYHKCRKVFACVSCDSETFEGHIRYRKFNNIVLF